MSSEDPNSLDVPKIDGVVADNSPEEDQLKKASEGGDATGAAAGGKGDAKAAKAKKPARAKKPSAPRKPAAHPPYLEVSRRLLPSLRRLSRSSFFRVGWKTLVVSISMVRSDVVTFFVLLG